MNIRKIFLLSLFILAGFGAKAQSDLTLYNMRWAQQSMYSNPAFRPATRVNIGLPVISSIYADIGHTGFRWKDLFVLTPDDSLELNIDGMLDKLGRRNYIQSHVAVDLLSVGLQIKEKNFFSLAIRQRLDTRFTYPGDFMRLVAKGNGAFLGETADLSGLGLDFTAYTEYGFGYRREINDRLAIGGKLKYLSGQANVDTRSKLALFTDAETFDLTASSSMTLHTSGFEQAFVTVTSTDSAGNTSESIEFRPDTILQSYSFGQNGGMGLDLGAQFKINDQIEVSASLVDFGFIKWKANPYTLTSDEAEFTFSGLDIRDFPAGNDSLNQAWFDSLTTALVDSIEGTFVLDSNREAYTTFMIPRFHIGGNYHINEKMDAGLLFTGEVYKGQFRPAVTASFNTRLGKLFAASLSYSYVNRSFTNLGVGIIFNAGPVQIYAVSDNVLAPMAPQSVRRAHVHGGINIAFGREKKDRDGDGIPDKQDDCPDDPGPEEFNGCPDRDEDSIIDKLDSCPDTPGIEEFQGCPDRDGDHIQDSEDDCPDDPGLAEFNGCPDRDGDKIIDKLDSCPDLPGIPKYNGCPDTDEDGLIDPEDRCPEEFGPKENQGCPWGDADGDGVLDKDDRCPDTPGPKENQGCPWGDMDGDGVVDPQDSCPKTPGPIDNNGCPELDEEEEEILKTAFDNLEFESGKAIIKATSYESLDSLASLLSRKPSWRLDIAGHTDNVGSDQSNMTLSKNRAMAVRDYLMNRGVPEDRFKVEWFGETRPLYPNNTPEGRQKNRRVEMTIVFE